MEIANIFQLSYILMSLISKKKKPLGFLNGHYCTLYQNLVFFLFHGIERLAESLRTIPTSPAVQSAVFLCFRVILIRMSPQHVTSLWPLIITEMVQIFSYLEQELSTDSEEWR